MDENSNRGLTNNDGEVTSEIPKPSEHVDPRVPTNPDEEKIPILDEEVIEDNRHSSVHHQSRNRSYDRAIELASPMAGNLEVEQALEVMGEQDRAEKETEVRPREAEMREKGNEYLSRRMAGQETLEVDAREDGKLRDQRSKREWERKQAAASEWEQRRFDDIMTLMSTREEAVKMREDGLREREERLMRKEVELEAREDELREREERLTKKEVELEAREDRLREEEKQLRDLSSESSKNEVARHGAVELFRGHTADRLLWLQDISRREMELRQDEESLRQRQHQNVEAWIARLDKMEADDRDERKWRYGKDEEERERRETKAMEWVDIWRKELAENAARREDVVRRKEEELKEREEKLAREVDEARKEVEMKRDKIHQDLDQRDREMREREVRRMNEMEERESRKEEEWRLKEEEWRKKEPLVRKEIEEMVRAEWRDKYQELDKLCPSVSVARDEMPKMRILRAVDTGNGELTVSTEEKWQERRRAIEFWVREDCDGLRREFEQKMQTLTGQLEAERGKWRGGWVRSGRRRFRRVSRGGGCPRGMTLGEVSGVQGREWERRDGRGEVGRGKGGSKSRPGEFETRSRDR